MPPGGTRGHSLRCARTALRTTPPGPPGRHRRSWLPAASAMTPGAAWPGGVSGWPGAGCCASWTTGTARAAPGERAVPVKLKFRGGLFHCGRCRKSFSSPLGHVCMVRNPRGKVRLKPRASASLAKCGTCGKEYANPLGHVCSVKTDFKKRKAAGQRREAAEAKRAKAFAARAREVAARQARREKENEARRARRAREDAARRGRRAKETSRAKTSRAHDYRNCRDHDCERAACEAYREGIADGTELAEAER